MEKLNDNELQELLDQAQMPGNDSLNLKDVEDFLAYQNLFKVLDSEPETGLSFSFASNVRRKVQEKLNHRSDMRFNYLAIAIFTIAIVLGYGLLYLINKYTAELVLDVAIKFKWVFLTVIFTFFCFLLIGQRQAKRDY